MTKQTVLVSGATGDTGGYAIHALTKLEVSIRAIVRKDDERAENLRASGVEVVLGNLLDLDSVRSAMEGVSAAYFVYPLIPGLIDATAWHCHGNWVWHAAWRPARLAA
jgi:NAD(P)H dehydrogenase (quinone)